MGVHFHPAPDVAEELYWDSILTAQPCRVVKAGPLLRRLGVESRGALWASIQVDGAELQLINTILTSIGGSGEALCPRGPHSGAYIYLRIDHVFVSGSVEVLGLKVLRTLSARLRRFSRALPRNQSKRHERARWRCSSAERGGTPQQSIGFFPRQGRRRDGTASSRSDHLGRLSRAGRK
jgi:hypothetical protein